MNNLVVLIGGIGGMVLSFWLTSQLNKHVLPKTMPSGVRYVILIVAFIVIATIWATGTKRLCGVNDREFNEWYNDAKEQRGDYP